MYPLKGKRKFISICKSWITLEISCKPILYAICFSLEICLFVKRIWIVKRKAVEDIVCKVRTQDPDEVVTRRKMSWVCHVQPLLWPLRSESFLIGNAAVSLGLHDKSVDEPWLRSLAFLLPTSGAVHRLSTNKEDILDVFKVGLEAELSSNRHENTSKGSKPDINRIH